MSPTAPGAFASVSCPDSTSCVALGDATTFDGISPISTEYAYVTRNRGASWSAFPVDPPALMSAVDCPSVGACYGIGGVSTPGGSPEVYVSHDLGRSWTPSTLPASLESTASAVALADISCPSAHVCEVVGDIAPNSTFALRTTDGGDSWIEQSLPTQVQSVLRLSCASASTCTATGLGPRSLTLSSRDGGSSWAVRLLPSGFVSNSLSCVAARVCELSGYTGASRPNDYGFMRSTDAGAHWAAEHLHGLAVDSVTAVTCLNSSVCEAVGTNRQGKPESLRTTDGGLTWHGRAIGGQPSTTLPGISCSALDVCEAVGETGYVAGGSVAAAYGTKSGGVTWSAQYGPDSTPSAPTSVVAVPNGPQVDLRWVASRSSGGLYLKEYRVSVKPSCATCSGLTVGGLGEQYPAVASTQTVISGLKNGVAYTFTVRARNPVGYGPSSRASNTAMAGPACTPSADFAGAVEFYQLPLTNGVATGSPWNVTSADGTLVQCYQNAQLTTTIGLSNLSYQNPGPAGYAEIAFGDSYKDMPSCIATCSTAPFPLRASTVSSDAYSVQVSYATTSTNSDATPYDWGMDLWLERSPSRGAAPKSSTDAEILIEPYNNGLQPPGCPLTPDLFTTTIQWNGASTPSSWSVCVGPGGAGISLVTFELMSPSQSSTGNLSVPLAPFIAAASSASGLHLTSNHLMGIEFGTEYGNWTYTGNVQLAWTVSSMSLSDSANAVIPIVGG